MDKQYWENYYSTTGAPQASSLFAQFVFDKHLKPGETLIELGCGNGRDSTFFAHRGLDVMAVDQCQDEIVLLEKNNSLQNLKFLNKDFTKLEALGPLDHIYSRFTLHSISAEDENNVIAWAHQNLKPGGKLLVEARGKQNELYQLGQPVEGEPDAYIYDNHYRRFVDLDGLCEKLTATGFNLISAEEDSGFAPFGETDYKFIRVVAEKK